VSAWPGDTGRAEALADALSKRYPEDTIVRFKELPTVNARVALSHNDPLKAIEWLQTASLWELGVAGDGEGGNASDLYPIYLRGEAYLSADDGGTAVGEFQRIIDHRSIGLNCVGALAHLGIARAYVLQGDTAKGKIAYQDFLGLWKDADADNSILLQAKAEYAKLR
jgi:eukaryotic-like serine/threonine-protein kinase